MIMIITIVIIIMMLILIVLSLDSQSLGMRPQFLMSSPPFTLMMFLPQSAVTCTQEEQPGARFQAEEILDQGILGLPSQSDFKEYYNW